jgi:hypothetical protein
MLKDTKEERNLAFLPYRRVFSMRREEVLANENTENNKKKERKVRREKRSGPERRLVTKTAASSTKKLRTSIFVITNSKIILLPRARIGNMSGNSLKQQERINFQPCWRFRVGLLES